MIWKANLTLHGVCSHELKDIGNLTTACQKLQSSPDAVEHYEYHPCICLQKITLRLPRSPLFLLREAGSAGSSLVGCTDIGHLTADS